METVSATPIAPRNSKVEDAYPLSPMQKGLLFHSLHNPELNIYVVQLKCTINDLDTQIWKDAWAKVTENHPPLRTAFAWENPVEPLQVVGRSLVPTWREFDWADVKSPEKREQQIAALMEEDRRQGYTLSKAPLFRLYLCRLSPTRHFFLWSYHHIILDGWSASLVMEEVFATYAALQRGERVRPRARTAFRSYIEWVKRQNLVRAEEFWRRELDQVTGPTPFGVDSGTVEPLPTDEAYIEIEYAFPLTESEALKQLCRESQLTLNTLFQGAWALLLSRYSGLPEIVFGATVSGRPPILPDVEEMVGLFINTLPLRVTVPGEERVLSWLKRLQVKGSEIREYEYTPLNQIYSWLQSARKNGLFESTIVFENLPVDLAVTQDSGGLRIEGARAHWMTSFPLTIMVVPGKAIRLHFSYDQRRFSVSAMQRMREHFCVVLHQILDRPHAKLREINPTTAEELTAMEDSPDPQPSGTRGWETLVEGWERSVAQWPDRVALRTERGTLTYGELDQQSTLLGRALRRWGTQSDEAVGLCLERSLEMIVALWGILKAGAAYAPLDPEDPTGRLAQIVADGKIKRVIAQSRFAAHAAATGVQVLSYDGEDLRQRFAAEPVAPLPVIEPDALAYVIHTSGTTGKPKGVMISHRAISNRLQWMQDTYRLSERDVVLLKTQYTFDVSVWEFFWPVLFGSTLVVARPGGHRDPEYLAQIIEAERVSVLHFVPSMLDAFLAEDISSRTASLRQVICSGEVLSFITQETFFRKIRCALANLYGPTEVAVDVTSWDCRPGAYPQGVPIGRPIAGIQIRVTEADLNRVPFGAFGHLLLAGIGLGRGYLQKPGLTAAAFVPDPYGPAGTRVYQTGDVVQLLPDGNLLFAGRRDSQIKLRGLRVELGEIESRLRAHPDVKEGLVRVFDKPGGGRDLVVYWVARERAPSDGELRSHLGEGLAHYMVPAHYVLLESLPRSSSGKIDLRALPSPQLEANLIVPPRTPLEKSLAKIWCDVLKIEQLGVDDSFFELGGDSILSLRVRSKAAKEGIDFPLEDIFRYPTVAALAARIDLSEASVRIPISGEAFSLVGEEDRRHLPAGVVDAYPLSRLQAGMIFHSELANRGSVFHDVFSYRVNLPYQAKILDDCVDAAVQRHPVLRTSFHLRGFTEPLQLVHAMGSLRIVDLVPVVGSTAEERAALKTFIAEERNRGFDFAESPLVRVFVQRGAEEGFYFILSFFHGILDGWSVASLLAELVTAYSDAIAGKSGKTPAPLRANYRDFIRAERALLADSEARSFWTQQLAMDRWTTLPLPRNEFPSGTRRGSSVQMILPVSPKMTDGLHALADELRVPLRTVLLAAHCRVLERFAGSPALITGTVTNSRLSEQDGDRVLGVFLNLIPWTIEMPRGNWRDLIRVVFEREKIYHPYRAFPYAEVQRIAKRNALFTVAFDFTHFHVYRETETIADFDAEGAEFFEETDLPLMVSFSEDPLSRTLSLRLIYDNAALETRVVEAMREDFAASLNAMAEGGRADFRKRQEQPIRSSVTESCALPLEGIHEAFLKQAQRTPDAIALRMENRSISFRVVERRARCLASWLRQQGVAEEETVGVFLERSPELIVSLIAILIAGGRYLPLDPTYPRERIEFMLSDARPKVVLTQGRLREAVPETAGIVLCVDHDWPAELPPAEASSLSSPDQAAYVIYTSGSTGRPKGVVGTHGGAMNRFRWMWEAYPFQPDEVACVKTSLSFVDSIWEIFGPLLQGITLLIVPEGILNNPPRFLELLRDHSVTRIVLVPSLLRFLLSNYVDLAERLPCLRFWSVSGEALVGDLIELFRRVVPEGRLLNIYGSSEVSADVTFFEVSAGRGFTMGVPIGRPYTNVEIQLLNEQFEPTSPGMAGEIYVGGVPLARGYLRRPALTAERFLPHGAGAAGSRLFRTGDRGVLDPEGDLIFLGRVDQQIKSRGFRIELSEIEHVLRQAPLVVDAAVGVRLDALGDNQVIAYLVMRPEAGGILDQARDHVARHLPGFMLPRAYVALPQLPLTPSGKLDRNALPVPRSDDFLNASSLFVAPRTDLERQLAEIWMDALGINHVGILDNFFDLGGHSLLANQLIVHVAEVFGTDVSLLRFFDNPTIQNLAEIVEGKLVSPAMDSASVN